MEIKFDPKKIKVVPIEEVRPNTWNPKDKQTKEYATVKAGLKLKGLRLPVIVRENDGYEIIDGEQRWTAWGELGNKTIVIYNEGKMSDQEAREMTIWYEQKVPFNEVKLAELVVELKLNYSDLEVPFPSAEIERMTDLVKFDWSEYEVGGESKEGDSSGEKRTFTVQMVESDYIELMSALDKVRELEAKKLNDGQALMSIIKEFLGAKQ